MFQIFMTDDEGEVLYNIQDFTCVTISFDSLMKITDLFFSLKQIDAMERKEEE